MKPLEKLFSLASIAGLLLAASLAFAEDTPMPTPHEPAFCKENPGKCEQARARHEAFCRENPEKCEQWKEKRAERQAYCQQNPEKCEQQRERMKQRRAEMQARCAADPEKCEEMKQARRERRKNRLGGGMPNGPAPDAAPPDAN